MPQTLSPLDILTSGGSHSDFEKDPECTTDVRVHAADLAERVSKLLDHLGVKPRINSGFRTTRHNKSIGGAASSSHCTGQAVDLADPTGSLAATVTADPGLLVTYDLYMENAYYTKTWCHLQTRPTASGRRIFTP